MLDGELIEDWFNILKSGEIHGQLNISIQYTPKENLEQGYGVDCYFPVRENCRVTLYQDAHVPPDLPQFQDLSVYPKDCWNDMYHSVVGAERFICITGTARSKGFSNNFPYALQVYWPMLSMFLNRFLSQGTHLKASLLIFD